MARPRGLILPDQPTKLHLIGEKLGLHKRTDWCEAFNIASQGTLTNWFSGLGIDQAKLRAIAKRLNIGLPDFDLEPYQFGAKIGLQEDIVRHVISQHGTQNPHTPNINDSINLNNCLGEYAIAYHCRLDSDVRQQYFAIRRFRIGPLESPCLARFVQLKNSITKQEERGSISCINERLVGRIQYRNSYYPESVYYLRPILLDPGQSILYGIYTDITSEPLKEIFATRVLFFGVSDSNIRNCEIQKSSRMFSPLFNLLVGPAAKRTRLVVSPSYDDDQKIVRTVDALRKALGTCQGLSHLSP